MLATAMDPNSAPEKSENLEGVASVELAPFSGYGRQPSVALDKHVSNGLTKCTLASIAQSHDKSEDQSILKVPLPSNSADMGQDPHLRLARIVDASKMWDRSPESESKAPTQTINETKPDLKIGSILPEEHQHIHKSKKYDPSLNSKKGAMRNDGKLTEEKHSWNSNDIETRLMSPNVETDAEEFNLVDLTSSDSESDLVHVLAEWPRTNTDFDALTEMDDVQSMNNLFYSSDQVYDVLDTIDPDDWFVKGLSDDDIPPGRRLFRNPGEFCLTSVESWERIDHELSLIPSDEEPDHK